MKNLMNLIGKRAIEASKKKISSKNKNSVLNKYVYLINKNSKFIIKQNNKDIKLALKKKTKK